MRKGIILAGGSGTRLQPLTLATSKQLLPVYDKPMIYYSLSILMLAGINDILIICNKDDLMAFKKLFHDSKRLGLNLSYEIQESPNGIAEALIIGEKFLDGNPCCLVLGDNFLFGQRAVGSHYANDAHGNGGKGAYAWLSDTADSGSNIEFAIH